MVRLAFACLAVLALLGGGERMGRVGPIGGVPSPGRGSWLTRLLGTDRRLPPKWQGHVRVEKKIAEGNTCRVYECSLRDDVAHPGQERRMALKVMKLGGRSELHAFVFQRESHFLQLLDGPSFIGLLDTAVKPTRRGEVQMHLMELAHSDLEEVIWRRSKANPVVPEELMIKLMLDITRGLAQMHELSLVHRDISPNGILIVGDWSTGTCSAKLSGLRLTEGARESHAEIDWGHIGYAPYQSPEAVRSEVTTTQDLQRADVWSAGMLFLHMLAGLPKDWQTRANVECWSNLHDSLVNRFKLVHIIKTQVHDEDLAALLESMLHKTPRKRPTLSKVLRDLQLIAERRNVYALTGTSPFGPELVPELQDLAYESPMDVLERVLA